jgi:hypothetical protein
LSWDNKTLQKVLKFPTAVVANFEKEYESEAINGLSEMLG